MQLIKAIQNLRTFTWIVFILCALIATPSCKTHKCPANGGDWDRGDVSNARKHKPKLGLWPKGKRPY